MGNARGEPRGTRRNEAGGAERIAGRLLLACVFASSFTHPSFWPRALGPVQAAELVFLLVLPAAMLAYRGDLVPRRAWILSTGAYVAANLVSAIASGAFVSVLEALGRGYLVILSWTVAAYVGRAGDEGARRVALAWLGGGLVQAVAGIAGWILAMLGVVTATVKLFPSYPYFGTVFRATGFTTTPDMLVLVLAFPLLWLWTARAWSIARSLAFAVLCIAMLLSLSKEVVPIAMAMALLHPSLAARRQPVRAAVAVATALVVWGGSHALLGPVPTAGESPNDTPYTSGRVLASGKGFRIVETTYWTLKRANWEIGCEHPLLGVGPGRANVALARLKTEGRYPGRLPNYDPHSVWLGAFSETGVLGVVTLAAMTVAWFAWIRRRRLLATSDPAVRAAAMYLVVLLVVSVMIDVMNFRQLWIAAGLLMGSARSIADERESRP